MLNHHPPPSHPTRGNVEGTVAEEYTGRAHADQDHCADEK
jgi:hypothetical protein